MAENNISGPNESVVTSTGSGPVVLDMSFSQPVSVSNSFLSFVLGMSDSSRVPNIFTAPVMQAILLRPIYDRDAPTHPSEEVDHRRLRDAPVVTPAPFSGFDCMD